MGFIAPPRGIGSGLLWSWYLVSVREVLFSSAAMCRRIPPLRKVSVRDEARQQLWGMNEMKCKRVGCSKTGFKSVEGTELENV